jgi:hypothetical protein
MKHFSLSAFLLGIGFGLIFSYFVVLFDNRINNPEDYILEVPDEVVIERAKELGLIDPTEGISKESIKTNAEN